MRSRVPTPSTPIDVDAHGAAKASSLLPSVEFSFNAVVDLLTAYAERVPSGGQAAYMNALVQLVTQRDLAFAENEGTLAAPTTVRLTRVSRHISLGEALDVLEPYLRFHDELDADASRRLRLTVVQARAALVAAGVRSPSP
jgi:hypothetical protein